MAVYPGASSQDSDLYIAVNNLSTTLSDNPLTSGATTVNVSSTTGFPSVGFISIDSEVIKYTGITISSFTGCTRGADGTTPTSHTQNSQVSHNIVAAHHNASKDEIKAVESDLVSAYGNVPIATSLSTALISLGKLVLYRRPTLGWQDSSHVAIEAGTDGSGNAVVIFPDGDVRSESTTTHIYLAIGNVASLSGTKQSGRRSGVSLTNNSWYAVYAVKATDNTTDFVAVADTVLPLQANYTTLSTNFGTYGWVYLGLIRYGDNASSPTGIVDFTMHGNYTKFNNDAAGAEDGTGVRLATTAGATSLTYTYASGTGTTSIPDNTKLGIYSFSWEASAQTDVAVRSSANTRPYYMRISQANSGAGVILYGPVWRLSDGVTIGTAATSTAKDIFLSAFIDSVLGVGSNPFF